MDRKSILGLVLIAAIVILFSVLNMPSQEEIDAQNRINDSITRVQDSLANLKKTISRDNGQKADTSGKARIANDILKADSTKKELTKADSVKIDSLALAEEVAKNNDQFGIFSNSARGNKDYFVIENDLLRITIASKGGGIASAELKKYHSYKDYVAKNNAPLKLFDADSSRMALAFFVNNKRYTSDEFYFTGNVKDKTHASVKLTSNDGTKFIEIFYSMVPGKYNVDYQVKTQGFANNEVNESLEMQWNMRPLLTEKYAASERQVSSVFYKYIDESRTYLSEYSNDEKNLEAPTEWIAFKTAYFSNVIIGPKEGIKKEAGRIEIRNVASRQYLKQYNAYISLATSRNEKDVKPLKFYFGPNDYEILKDQGHDMENIINLGWGIFGWVNKWLVIPVFRLLEAMHLNYGIIILLLTLIVKIIIMPLTYRNYKSSAKMRVLKPEIAELSKKFGPDEAMKKQQATMALYRQSGVSPLAGCIPVLIQMPVLIAVFRFFPSAIQLRQENFLWAEDLSAYDSVANLGMHIPAYGDHISLFTILMCASTILFTYVNRGQMDQGNAMPGMKFMMYFFPVMMLFFFNTMASGLSYYYFISNILSIVIMWLVKKYFIDEKKIRMQIEEYKKRPEASKKSKFQQRLEEAQKQRAEQLKKKKK